MTSSGDLVRAAREAAVEQASPVPRRRLSVVTCMDVRIDPMKALSLAPGDAHVVRNAGGVVTDDVLRSLVVSQQKLQTVAVDVMMHTNCGMLGLDEHELRTGLGPAAAAVEFHPFDDLEEELLRGVARVRESALLAHRGSVRGLIYDVSTHRVRVVVP